MNRRTFLAGGAGAAGSASWMARSAGADARAAPVNKWDWSCSAGHLEIALGPTGVTIDCFPPGGPRAQLASHVDGASEPLAALGIDHRPVTWELAAWQEPDSHNRRLLLTAHEHPLQADISFSCDPATGFLSQRVLFSHGGGDREIDIRTTNGFAVRIHEPIERILYLTGGWTEETEIQRAHPNDGVLVLESRSGKTGFEFQPYVALRTAADTYLCQILWSGNWLLTVEPHSEGVALSGGLNNWHFRHRLRAGDTLELPTVLFGRFNGSLNPATHRLHDYRRARRPNADRPIPVQFNSWYPYLGEPTAELLTPLIPVVKRLGCEAFVVDAGWYRTDEGESDAEWMQRTGDWRTSRRRFPGGLREISSHCREHGLLFGLWFEPEVISASSSIRRDHPEWLHHIDGKETSSDQRAILHLGVPAAWQHVFARLSRMLGLIGVDWMKWDFNADLGDGGWAPALPEELTRRDPLIAHYDGLYRLQDAIRTAFPNLVLEMCAGGGGRMDGAILSHAHVNWMSDQAGALRKLAIHFGTQLAHPAVVCNDWLIDWPGNDDSRSEPMSLIDWRGDLAFRLRVAMLGTFGISAPVDRWSPADRAEARREIALYKTKIRPLVHKGDQYYLTRAPRPDGSSDWAAIWYAGKDGRSGILFAFRLAGSNGTRRFALPGLHADRRYKITLGSGLISTASGADLAAGVSISLAETFRSELCLVEAVG